MLSLDQPKDWSERKRESYGSRTRVPRLTPVQSTSTNICITPHLPFTSVYLLERESKGETNQTQHREPQRYKL